MLAFREKAKQCQGVDPNVSLVDRAKNRSLFLCDLLDKKVQEFKARVYSCVDRFGVRGNWLDIRDTKNKWASCSTNGNLNFNSELLGLGSELQDYFIVQELLYFNVTNHGMPSKSLMTAHLGNYQELERRFGAQNQ